MKVDLSVEDVKSVSHLLRFASRTDSRFMAICARAQLGNLTWVATDNRRLARIRRGTANVETGAVGVPLRDMSAFIDAAIALDRPLTLEVNGDAGKATIPGVLVATFQNKLLEVVTTDDASQQLPRPDSTITLRTRDLRAAVLIASRVPDQLEESARKLFTLTSTTPSADVQGQLAVNSSWFGHPDITAYVFATSEVAVTVAVDPSRIVDLLDVIDEPEVTLEVGRAYGVPIHVRAANGLSILMLASPYGLEAHRPAFERVFAELCRIEVENIVTNEDRSYPFKFRSNQQAVVRLDQGDLNRGIRDHITVATTVATGVEPTLLLLKEINSLNLGLRFVRIVLDDDEVRVEANALLEGLDVTDLRNAVEAVADVSVGIGPLIQSYGLGAETDPDRGPESETGPD